MFTPKRKAESQQPSAAPGCVSEGAEGKAAGGRRDRAAKSRATANGARRRRKGAGRSRSSFPPHFPPPLPTWSGFVPRRPFRFPFRSPWRPGSASGRRRTRRRTRLASGGTTPPGRRRRRRMAAAMMMMMKASRRERRRQPGRSRRSSRCRAGCRAAGRPRWVPGRGAQSRASEVGRGWEEAPSLPAPSSSAGSAPGVLPRSSPAVAVRVSDGWVGDLGVGVTLGLISDTLGSAADVHAWIFPGHPLCMPSVYLGLVSPVS